MGTDKHIFFNHTIIKLQIILKNYWKGKICTGKSNKYIHWCTHVYTHTGWSQVSEETRVTENLLVKVNE